jgi:polar amino acid transport system substrate-binding protein
MFMLDATEERRKAVDFPEHPLLYYSLAVLAREALEIEAWEDLNRPEVRVAVPQATSMDAFLTENVPNATIMRFPGNTESIAAFQAGRVDAVVLFHPPLVVARKNLGFGRIVVPKPVLSRPSSVAVRKEEDRAFLEWVDRKIAEYYRSGQTQKWYEEALADFGLDPKSAPPVMRELLP